MHDGHSFLSLNWQTCCKKHFKRHGWSTEQSSRENFGILPISFHCHLWISYTGLCFRWSHQIHTCLVHSHFYAFLLCLEDSLFRVIFCSLLFLFFLTYKNSKEASKWRRPHSLLYLPYRIRFSFLFFFVQIAQPWDHTLAEISSLAA